MKCSPYFDGKLGDMVSDVILLQKDVVFCQISPQGIQLSSAYCKTSILGLLERDRQKQAKFTVPEGNRVQEITGPE